MLLRAYARLGDAPPLVLIGPVRPDTPAELPPKVIVLLSWPDPAVLEAWRRCLIGLAPSIRPDPCPTVVMEAMAAGKPVVGSQIGGLSDLVADEETGLLVPHGDAGQLAQSIRRLLVDPGLREKMGQAGGNRVVQFQAPAVIPLIEEAYREVAA